MTQTLFSVYLRDVRLAHSVFHIFTVIASLKPTMFNPLTELEGLPLQFRLASCQL